MEIISRRDASAKGLTQYFTGKPCIHEHIAYRYTQSGTCSQCVMTRTDETRDSMRHLNVSRREAKAELLEVRMRAYTGDLPMLRQTAAALCKARYPLLTDAELVCRGVPTGHASGTAMYLVRVPFEDEKILQDVANALFSAHKVDISWTRQHALKVTLEEAEKGSTPPEWTERP